MASRTKAQVEVAMRGLGKRRWDAVLETTSEGEPDGIGVSLVAALAMRETNMKNIVGDGGRGRGWLQIDDRAHAEFLRKFPGVLSGTWDRYTGHSALYPNHCPSMTRSVLRAIEILRANVVMAKRAGVPDTLRLRVAVAGYNCGMGNALAAWRRYGISGVDRYTTGGDYSEDVYALKEHVVSVAKKIGWDLG